MGKTLGPGAHGDPENPAQSREQFDAAQNAAPIEPPAAKKPAAKDDDNGDGDGQ